MSIWNRFRRKQKHAQRATLRDESGWLFDALTNGRNNPSGEVVNEKTALGIAAYFASIRNISEDIAKLPRKVYELDSKGNRTEDRGHNVRDVIMHPNPHTTAFSFWQTLVAHALGYQAGYAEIVMDKITGTQPRGLWPLDPRSVTPWVSDDGATLIYRVRDRHGREIVLDSDHMFVLHGLGFDGYTGYVLARVAATTLGAIAGANTFRASYFGNSLNPTGFFEVPPTLSETATENFMTSVKEKLRGAKNAHGAHVLPDGIKWVKHGTDPKDSQLLESGNFGIEEVARLFRMPPSKLMHMINSSVRANLEQENKSYYTDTLSPWAIKIEQEIDRKLFTPKERKTHFVEHTFDALLLADTVQRHEALAKGFGTGLYTINDMLKIENRPPIGPKGDVRFVPHNLKSLDEAIAPPPTQPVAKEIVREITTIDTSAQIVRESAATWRRMFKSEFFSCFRVERDKARRAEKGSRYAEWHSEFYGARHTAHVQERVHDIVAVIVTAHSADAALVDQIAEAVAANYNATVSKEVAEHLGDGDLKSHNALADRMADGALAICQRMITEAMNDAA